jgi:FtsP/CotA-like multicopper oxidase with cupredoxin domain
VSEKEEAMTRPRALVPGLILCCVLVAGCGGGDDDGGQAAPSITVTSVAAASTTEGPSTSEAPTTTAGFSGTLIEAKVTGSDVETASRRVRVDRGERVRIRVQADRNEEVHVHGYDLSQDVAPGKPATIEFTADAPGVFEVELEQAALKLFELQVQ